MAYEWPRGLCNGRGVPYEKLAGVYLEKTDVNGEVVGAETFLTQDAVDEAWATGYHSPGKPETRDVEPEGSEIAPAVVAEPETIDDLTPAGADEFEMDAQEKAKTKKKGK